MDRATYRCLTLIMNDKLKSFWKVKFPNWFWGKLPFNYGWELIVLHKLREWRDGISFFEFRINLDRYDPLEYVKFMYQPRLDIHFVVLNYTIFEFEVYKRNN